MLKILITFVVFFSSLSFASIDPRVERVVKDTVIDEYSEGFDSTQFQMSKDDVWGLKMDSDIPLACTYLVTGYANKPNNYGSTLHSVWVCIIVKSCGKMEGIFWADDQLADE